MMTDIAIWLIATGALVAAGFGVVNRKAIRDMHIIMNSRLDELIKTTSDKAFFAGTAAGRAEVVQENAEAQAKLLDQAAARDKGDR